MVAGLILVRCGFVLMIVIIIRVIIMISLTSLTALVDWLLSDEECSV